MKKYRFSLCVFFFIVILSVIGLFRLDIDTDVVRSLPSDEKIIADGLAIFEQHPIHDQIAVDIMLDRDDPDRLVEICSLLETKLMESGLFAQVGTGSFGERIPELAVHVAKNLPLLFSAQELEQKVAPLIETPQITSRIHQLYQDLSTMEGVGQLTFMALDPLGLKDLVLAKMAPLAPSLKTKMYKGRLLSADGHHILVTARPHAAGTNTAAAGDISELIAKSGQEISKQYGAQGMEVILTPVGGYRAALDNERIIRHDVNLALVLATAGIGLLLLISFPRPLIGLLSLLPAFAGMGTALFVYSLFHSSISIMVLGFGSAIISITVDHGVTYLLFLDRSHKTSGSKASHEVRAIGIMAVITSIGAFLILSCSGFPIFTELGRFTALGILFSFLFVHWVFPRIFPSMTPGRERKLPLRHVVNALYNTGKPGIVAACVLALVLLFFAKPQFHVSLSSMNTVSESTLAADKLFTSVWGNVGQRVFLMNSADTIADIQQGNDTLLAKLEQDIENGLVGEAFVPSMIFPGRERGEQNLQAWQAFWDTDRVEHIQKIFNAVGAGIGFTPDAFTPFFALLDNKISTVAPLVSPEYYDLLGISAKGNTTDLVQFITILPGAHYDGAVFLDRYGKEGKIFDADFFTGRLADLLFSTFTSMLAIVAVSVVLLLYFFYLDLRLTLLTLLPPVFAYICTLGTLNLLGQPLDIPALMLSVVILGMGIDYSIFCVRAHQRYREKTHPSYGLVHVAVFIAGSSTLIGFGVLSIAEHSLLKSIGITSLLGIGYSMLGTFLLLPPLLDAYVAGNNQEHLSGERSLTHRIQDRFRTLETYPRMFARFKLRLDPMFNDLPQMLAGADNVQRIIDIGCGFGVPACWCLERFPGAKVYGLDPDPERVRVAAIAADNRGIITEGLAPDIPVVPGGADVVLLLDMLHYLDDDILQAVLSNCYGALRPEGLLVARFVIRPPGKPSWLWRLEDVRITLSGQRPWYRPQELMAQRMEEENFMVTVNEISSVNPELVWMVGRAAKETTGSEY